MCNWKHTCGVNLREYRYCTKCGNVQKKLKPKLEVEHEVWYSYTDIKKEYLYDHWQKTIVPANKLTLHSKVGLWNNIDIYYKFMWLIFGLMWMSLFKWGTVPLYWGTLVVGIVIVIMQHLMWVYFSGDFHKAKLAVISNKKD